jgi:rfaE bifunctional protein nucleotidyltransferase chain/domain
MQLSQQTQELLKNREGKKIVFTNGCFDILHRGHLTYLADAAKLGDALILGLNSDASVKRLKGEDRPINDEEDRKFFLEALKSVAVVEIFEEDTPLKLIEAVTPDLLVKGGDYDLSTIVGREHVEKNGGKVLTIPFVDGYSSTKMIERIKKHS